MSIDRGMNGMNVGQVAPYGPMCGSYLRFCGGLLLGRPSASMCFTFRCKVPEVVRSTLCSNAAALMPHDGGRVHTVLVQEVFRKGGCRTEQFQRTGRSAFREGGSGQDQFNFGYKVFQCPKFSTVGWFPHTSTLRPGGRESKRSLFIDQRTFQALPPAPPATANRATLGACENSASFSCSQRRCLVSGKRSPLNRWPTRRRREVCSLTGPWRRMEARF
jgi:hypothetical protein